MAVCEVIVLRDADGFLVSYSDSDRIAMRRDVLEHNEFLTGLDIRVHHPEAYYDMVFLRVGSASLNPRRRCYHRVFNGKWTHGGRWYAPFGKVSQSARARPCSSMASPLSNSTTEPVT